MIYLFCNVYYGMPFIETLERFSREYGIPATLVLSRKSDITNPLVRNAWKPLRWAKARAQERQLARHYGLPVLIVENVNSLFFAYRVCIGDAGFIAGFNQILKARLITRFEHLINFHPSILPLYRGPVPSHWCMVNGEIDSGFTMHRVTERIDDGEILYQEVVPIAGLESEAEVDDRIARTAASCFDQYLREVMLRRNAWKSVTVDAFKVYKQHVHYLTFPEKTA